MKHFSLNNFPLENKTVFLRVDYNVPLEKNNMVVADNRRIRASLPTIKFLLEKNCKIVIATHFGRPEGKVVPNLRVSPLAEELQELLPDQKITKLDDCLGKEIKQKIVRARPRQIFLLENIRFYKEEEQNDPAFAQSLAELADVYVNDAFAVSHRQQASVNAITHYLPSFPGLLVEQEMFYLSRALRPKKPAVWLMGGAKLDKIDLLNQALKKADTILIGGALAFPFLRAKGVGVGMSKTDSNSVSLAQKILERSSYRKKIVLPIDFVVTEKMSPSTKTEIASHNEIKSTQIALDIGPKTVQLFKRHLSKAKTIVWNGPLGYFEWEKFAHGTKDIGRYMKELDCLKIAGGGETAEALEKFNLVHNFTHVSTGGGASLMYLSGKELPAITALEKNFQHYKKRINRGQF